MWGLLRTCKITIALLSLGATGAQAATAMDPCRWTLDQSFVSTLFLRLHTRILPSGVGTYLESTRFSFRQSSPGSGDLALTGPDGKNMGYLSINRETLNDPQGVADLPGYSLDIYIKPEHQPSGLGTLLMTLMAHHLDKQGLKLRAPVSHSDAAGKSFARFEASKLIKRVAAREDDGDAVQIWEFDVSTLSEKDRLDLDAIQIQGISDLSPGVTPVR